MSFLLELLFGSPEDKKKKNTDGLEEWQKKLVDDGQYEPDSFEEDGDLEEDDYYSEDED